MHRRGEPRGVCVSDIENDTRSAGAGVVAATAAAAAEAVGGCGGGGSQFNLDPETQASSRASPPFRAGRCRCCGRCGGGGARTRPTLPFVLFYSG
jgi:hypothetical protein